MASGTTRTEAMSNPVGNLHVDGEQGEVGSPQGHGVSPASELHEVVAADLSNDDVRGRDLDDPGHGVGGRAGDGGSQEEREGEDRAQTFQHSVEHLSVQISMVTADRMIGPGRIRGW